MRAADIEDNSVVWKTLFTATDFAAWIKNKYALTTGSLVANDD